MGILIKNSRLLSDEYIQTRISKLKKWRNISLERQLRLDMTSINNSKRVADADSHNDEFIFHQVEVLEGNGAYPAGRYDSDNNVFIIKRAVISLWRHSHLVWGWAGRAPFRWRSTHQSGSPSRLFVWYRRHDTYVHHWQRSEEIPWWRHQM